MQSEVAKLIPMTCFSVSDRDSDEPHLTETVYNNSDNWQDSPI